MRERLRWLFAETLDELQVAPWIDQWLRRHRAGLAGARLVVVAFGKAARAMTEALARGLAGTEMRGLVVPPEPDDAPLPPFDVIPGGHPLPTAGSLRAALAALALCRSVRPDERVLFLASGGGSSILELPADPTVTLEQLRGLYAALIGCGADITAVNTVRRHLSAIKGGRLALAAAAAQSQHTIGISDVPGDDVAALASGPSCADPTTLDDCRAVLARFALWPAVPPALRDLAARGDLPPPLLPGDPLLDRCATTLLQNNRLARSLLGQKAQEAGMVVAEDQSVDDMHYDAAAAILLARLDALRREHPGRTVAVISGGELSVPLPAHPGTGGRNQQFALACALRIEGLPIAVLSAGTDGVDGSAPAAGAIADGSTVARAAALGHDARDHLARCDAHPLFAALDDAVVTGPTGQNVRDLRLLVHAV